MEWFREIIERFYHKESCYVHPLSEDVLEARLSNKRSICELFPYVAYDKESEIFINDDTWSVMFMAQPTTSLSHDEIKNLEGMLCQCAPSMGYVQVILYAMPYCHEIMNKWFVARQKNKNKMSVDVLKTLTLRRIKYLQKAEWRSLFNDESCLVKDVFICISLSVDRPINATIDSVGSDKQILFSWRTQTQSLLKSIGISSININEDGLAHLMRSFLSPRSSSEDLPTRTPGYPFPMNLINDECKISIHQDHIAIQWKNHTIEWSSMTARSYPEYWSASSNGEFLGAFFQNHLQIPVPYVIVLNIYLPDSYPEEVKAKSKLIRSTQMQSTEVGKYVSAWRQRQRDWQWVQSRLVAGERLVKYSFQVISLSEPGRRQLSNQAIKNLFQRIGWGLSDDTYCMPYQWQVSMPMGLGKCIYRTLDKLGFYATATSSTVTQFMPFIGEWKGNVGYQELPLLMLLGRRGQLQYLNPYLNNKGNYNIAVAATSGAGKSFLTQEYACSVLAAGGVVYIIDAGGSYKNICQLLVGQYIDFSDNNEVSLDPFSVLNGEESVFIEHLPMFKSLVATMASPESKLSSKQMALLEQAIANACEKNSYQCLTLDELSAELLKNSDDLSIMLRPYTSNGVYGRFFNGAGKGAINSEFIVLELDSLNGTSDLQSVVLLSLIQKITQAMYHGDRDRYKLCIIDEAWRLLGHSQAGSFIEEGYRTARKYGGAFMTITQSLQDYKNSPAAIACFNNSDFLFLLRQKPETISQAKLDRQLSIGEWEEKMLKSLSTVSGKYSEIAMRTPDGWSMGRLIVDPWAEKMMSTRSEDWSALKKLEKKGMTKVQAITLLAGLRDEESV